MLAVLVSNLCTVALLVGLLAGIVAGVVSARGRIVDALAYEPPVDVTPRVAAQPTSEWDRTAPA